MASTLFRTYQILVALTWSCVFGLTSDESKLLPENVAIGMASPSTTRRTPRKWWRWALGIHQHTVYTNHHQMHCQASFPVTQCFLHLLTLIFNHTCLVPPAQPPLIKKNTYGRIEGCFDPKGWQVAPCEGRGVDQCQYCNENHFETIAASSFTVSYRSSSL